MSGPTLSPPKVVRVISEASITQLRDDSSCLSVGLSDNRVQAILNSHEQLRQQLTEAEARLASQQEELTDWILVADGLKHDWRCQHGIGPHNVVDPVCLRCRLEEATARLASQGEQIAQLNAEIDAAWVNIDHGWEIESRAELEALAKTNGFQYGLAQAVHHMWKRDRKGPLIEQLAAALTARDELQQAHDRLSVELSFSNTISREAEAARDEAEQRTTWQPMETAIKSGRIMLVKFRNALGNSRVIRAYYAPPRTVEIEDVDAFGADYDADEDKAWLPEGWYEAVEFDEDRPSYQIEDVLLGWMPLPKTGKSQDAVAGINEPSDEQVAQFATLLRQFFFRLSHAPEFSEFDEASYNHWIATSCASVSALLERMPSDPSADAPKEQG